jgi:hypothetical protein
MNENDESSVNALIDMNKHVIRSAIGLIDQQEEWIAAFKELYDLAVKNMGDLIDAIDHQSKARASRIRRNFVTGLLAFIAAGLSLWVSTITDTGFWQTVLVALGGAFLTFFLVSLILERIAEIPSKEENRRKQIVAEYTELNRQLIKKANDILQITETTKNKTQPLLTKLREDYA